MSVTVTLGKQGRFVVPADLRAELGLSEGDVLSVQRVGTRLIVERPSDAARSMRGMLADHSNGRSLVEELLAERISEAQADR
ncbi:MAG: AbrB/MazE/SpoVT family DNA-binding domain-containing protein [Rhodococcus sp. (in: high G+C Gram-positive bacteria)]|uniref:AbrB/MazE/SpoVT family DNA-binding domain-containing protein n=1 Tax=Rhodococcus sp. I2R TaxID=2855445 RepID=UPI001E4E7309|nr:AbrB/MazE/SpoVT family DNA-binding domain-containing protein [Rhodococcus sp. I2R]MCC8926682.1 AbrB/MazE/SpoVT family DNA-binding domain-containing protein [Rhodococcus sp. I2R]